MIKLNLALKVLIALWVLITPFLYFIGYLYRYGWLSYFRIDIEKYPLSFHEHVVNGGIRFFEKLTYFIHEPLWLIAIAVLFLISLVVILNKQSIEKLPIKLAFFAFGRDKVVLWERSRRADKLAPSAAWLKRKTLFKQDL